MISMTPFRRAKAAEKLFAEGVDRMVRVVEELKGAEPSDSDKPGQTLPGAAARRAEAPDPPSTRPGRVMAAVS